jgi:hypothetical protein
MEYILYKLTLYLQKPFTVYHMHSSLLIQVQIVSYTVSASHLHHQRPKQIIFRFEVGKDYLGITVYYYTCWVEQVDGHIRNRLEGNRCNYS